MNDSHSSYERWAWARFLRALDAAGYAVVQKPTITKGKPAIPGGGKDEGVR